MFKSVPLAMLWEGAVLGSAVFDPQQRLLLGAGIPISHDLVLGLHKRGVRNVVVSEKDWQKLSAFTPKGKSRNALPHHPPIEINLHCPATHELDDSLEQIDTCDVVPSEDPFSQRIQTNGATRYQSDRMARLIDRQQQSVDQVRDLLGQLGRGQSVATEAVQKLSKDALIQAAEDLDLFVCMGINPSLGDSVFAHSTNVSTLAIAIGATLGMDEELLCDLGTGCLIHDAGMLQIDQGVYKSDEVLRPHEFVEIAKHPVIATDMLYKRMDRVPLGVRMVVYQMHERCDGSGYPRGCTAERIHPLAKISGVADAYVALVSARPHRPAMMPYFAMAKILEDVREGLFDAAVVRGLLHTISLFPIGSYVELSNGQIGKVIRANGPAYDRPIVEAWHRNRLTELPDVIDLTAEAEVRVVKALSSFQ
jgi:HD-GYP domain-containing protein (c-di-GMP phosphodiesterase class II)